MKLFSIQVSSKPRLNCFGSILQAEDEGDAEDSDDGETDKEDHEDDNVAEADSEPKVKVVKCWII